MTLVLPIMTMSEPPMTPSKQKPGVSRCKSKTLCIKHKDGGAASSSSVHKGSESSAFKSLTIVTRLINVHTIIIHVPFEDSLGPSAGIDAGRSTSGL